MLLTLFDAYALLRATFVFMPKITFTAITFFFRHASHCCSVTLFFVSLMPLFSSPHCQARYDKREIRRALLR